MHSPFAYRFEGCARAKNLCEDTWDLVLDEELARVFVVHSWSYMDGNNPWPASDGSRNISVDEFRTQADPAAIRMLEALFSVSP